MLKPLLKEVESLTEKIKDSDREIEQGARKDFPTALLEQVGGVGPLIALAFIGLAARHCGNSALKPAVMIRSRGLVC